MREPPEARVGEASSWAAFTTLGFLIFGTVGAGSIKSKRYSGGVTMTLGIQEVLEVGDVGLRVSEGVFGESEAELTVVGDGVSLRKEQRLTAPQLPLFLPSGEVSGAERIADVSYSGSLGQVAEGGNSS